VSIYDSHQPGHYAFIKFHCNSFLPRTRCLLFCLFLMSHISGRPLSMQSPRPKCAGADPHATRRRSKTWRPLVLRQVYPGKEGPKVDPLYLPRATMAYAPFGSFLFSINFFFLASLAQVEGNRSFLCQFVGNSRTQIPSPTQFGHARIWSGWSRHKPNVFSFSQKPITRPCHLQYYIRKPRGK
jgi:hypothetical protein